MKSTNGKGVVVFKDKRSGILYKDDTGYTFIYDDKYFNDPESMPISISLPLTKKEYKSKRLFSFFDGLIPGGWALNAICSGYGIDKDDRFLILLHTQDTFGAVRVIPLEIEKVSQ